MRSYENHWLKNFFWKTADGVYRTCYSRLRGTRSLPPALTLIMSIDWLKYKLSYDVLYECTFNTMKSLKMIKITSFDQNHFMTCYLIFNFRPIYFSYFRNITAISISHYVKKSSGPKVVLTRSQGVNTYNTTDDYHFVLCKNL